MNRGRMPREVIFGEFDKPTFYLRPELTEWPAESVLSKKLLQDAAVGDIAIRRPGFVDIDVEQLTNGLRVEGSVKSVGIDERAINVKHHEMRHGEILAV